MLRLTWRGLETGYGEASEAPSDERDGQQIGSTYEIPRQSSTLPLICTGRTAESGQIFIYDIFISVYPTFFGR
jgi:hypothetical protein